MSTVKTPICPECDAEIPVSVSMVIGEVLSCSECGCELEIVSLDPLRLDLAPEIEEDWGE